MTPFHPTAADLALLAARKALAPPGSPPPGPGPIARSLGLGPAAARRRIARLVAAGAWPDSPAPYPPASPALRCPGARHDRLTAAEEVVLGCRAWGGDAGAVLRLVETNVALAREFAGKVRCAPADREDMEAGALMGLWKAATTFDPTRGVRFSTHAGWQIRRGIREVRVYGESLVHVPAYLRALRRRVDRGDVAAATLRPAHREFLATAGPVLRVATGEPAPPGSHRYLEFVEARPEPEATPESCEAVAATLAPLLAALGARERAVISERFGLGGRPPRLQKEIGADLGLPSSTVRSIEARAIRRLQVMARGKESAA